MRWQGEMGQAMAHTNQAKSIVDARGGLDVSDALSRPVRVVRLSE